MNRFRWREQYDLADDAAAGIETQIHNDEPSLTQQHFKDDADLNKIVIRFGITDGAFLATPIDPAYYGDFTDAVDYRTALDQVRDADLKFQALPADVRTRFNNDPVNLWGFVNDPRNADEAVKLGLLRRNDPKEIPTSPTDNVEG